jgi:hypothetical protein
MLKFIRSFWFSWILVTSIGAALGLSLGSLLFVLFGDDSVLVILGFLAIAGLRIGYGQWRLLRTKLTKSSGWVAATAVGLSFGVVLGYSLLAMSPHLFISHWAENWVIAITGGTFTGFLQWRASHSKFTGSAAWLLVSVLGWGMALNVSTFLVADILSYGDLEYLFVPILGLLIGAAVGMISGAFVETIIIRTAQSAS